jgi:cytochrome c553
MSKAEMLPASGMHLDFCVACGERDVQRLEHHHLVPRSVGGGDEEENLITLCGRCHGRVHDMKRWSRRVMIALGRTERALAESHTAKLR